VVWPGRAVRVPNPRRTLHDLINDGVSTQRPPIGELRRQYDEERYYGDDRAAAEYAYALALSLREEGDVDEARRYAQECLDLTEALPSRTLKTLRRPADICRGHDARELPRWRRARSAQRPAGAAICHECDCQGNLAGLPPYGDSWVR
jgi:hypothetical protein